MHIRAAVRAIKRGTPIDELQDSVSDLIKPKTKECVEADPDADGTPELQDELDQARAEFKNINTMMRHLWGAIDELAKSKLGVWIDMESVREDLRNLGSTMKFSKPHAVCPMCKGEGCEKCLDSGLLCEERHNAYTKSTP